MRTNKIAESREQKPSVWKTRLRRFFAQAWVEIVIGLLVLISVALTIFEFVLESQLMSLGSPVTSTWGTFSWQHLEAMQVVNDVITLIFVIELSLRFFAASSKRRFFAEFWLDIIATLPLFRVFRASRALRLLRLIRLVRLLGVMSRLSSHYPYIVRRGALDFLAICGLLAIVVAFGTLAMMQFENPGGVNGALSASGAASGTPVDAAALSAGAEARQAANSSVAKRSGQEFNFENSFWFSVYTLFAGEPVPNAPTTLMGKVVSVFLMFMGLTIFAIFAGTVSAFMVDRIRVEGRVVEWDEFLDHIVICGWTPKTEIIIREYRALAATKNKPIVVISELEDDQLGVDIRQLPNVFFVKDDFTKVSALERSGIRNAATCIVLSDKTGGRSEQDADARTILASLTVEKINEDVYTCAELVNRSYATHLDLGKVNEYVVSDEYGAYMMAQAAMNRGLVGVLGELLTYQKGNEFYRSRIPDAWIGKTFDEKMAAVKKDHNMILVAIHPVDGPPEVNPTGYIFKEGDEVVAISKGKPKLV